MSKARQPLAAGLAAAAMIVYRRFVRPWHQRWGATEGEVNGFLPGDDLIAEPASQITRAITIDAPPDAAWSWVIQLGADRGGFYSYDWLEDLFGLGIHSADDIVQGWQRRGVGELVYGDAKGRGGWYVMDVQSNRALVLQTADVKNGRPATRSDRAFMEFTWAFVLHEGTDSTTRLLVRERVAFRNELSRFLMSPVGLVSFVMTQKMMRGIKERVESRPNDLLQRCNRGPRQADDFVVARSSFWLASARKHRRRFKAPQHPSGDVPGQSGQQGCGSGRIMRLCD